MAIITTSTRIALCEDLILESGGTLLDPWKYARRADKAKTVGPMVEAFDEFRKDSGVEHFSGLEILTPSEDSQKHAREAGSKASEYKGQFVLVLPVWMWTPMIALYKGVCDPIRKAHGRAVNSRNSQRPWWINQVVATSGVDSDHPHTACADLDLTDGGDHYAAHRVADEFYETYGDRLEVSKGQSSKTIHISIFGPRGHRQWDY